MLNKQTHHRRKLNFQLGHIVASVYVSYLIEVIYFIIWQFEQIFKELQRMGVGISSNSSTLQETINKKYAYSKRQEKDYEYYIAIWVMKSESKQFQALQQNIQFFSDESYIVLFIKKLSTPRLTKIEAPTKYLEALFTLQAVTQQYFSQKYIECDKDTFIVCYNVFCGDSVSNYQSIQSIHEVSRLQEYIRRGQGYAIRKIFNEGKLWKSAKFERQDDILPKINLSQQQYSHLWKFQLFSSVIFQHNPRKKALMTLINNNKLLFNPQNPYPKIDLHPFQMKKKQSAIENINDISKPFLCQMSHISQKRGQGFEESDIFQDSINKMQISKQLYKIDTNIYTGDYESAKDYSLLARSNICLVINCAAAQCKNWFTVDFNYKWIFMKDSEDENVQCLLYDINETIEKVNGNIFIHCRNTTHRSTAVLIGLMMLKHKLGYEDAFTRVAQTWKQAAISNSFRKQLIQLQGRIRGVSFKKVFKIFAITSYQNESPKHLVAKYAGCCQKQSQAFSIPKCNEITLLLVRENSIKICIGQNCKYKQQYVTFAKQYIKLLQKYENAPYKDINIEENIKFAKLIDKPTQCYFEKLSLCIRNPIAEQKVSGYATQQVITFKYPLLRPVWQGRKSDCFYFVIRQNEDKAHVNMIKGQNWIGLEQDKNEFFDRIVKNYLNHIPDVNIWVQQEAQNSYISDNSFGF